MSAIVVDPVPRSHTEAGTLAIQLLAEPTAGYAPVQTSRGISFNVMLARNPLGKDKTPLETANGRTANAKIWNR